MTPVMRLLGGLLVVGLMVSFSGASATADDPRPDPEKLQQLKDKFGKVDPEKLAQFKEKLEKLKEKLGPEKFAKLMEKLKDRKGDGDPDRREKLKALLEKLKNKE